eukprot:403356685
MISPTNLQAPIVSSPNEQNFKNHKLSRTILSPIQKKNLKIMIDSPTKSHSILAAAKPPLRQSYQISRSKKAENIPILKKQDSPNIMSRLSESKKQAETRSPNSNTLISRKSQTLSKIINSASSTQFEDSLQGLDRHQTMFLQHKNSLNQFNNSINLQQYSENSLNNSSQILDKLNRKHGNENEFGPQDNAMNLLQHTKSEIKSICYNLERSIKGHDVYIDLTDEVNDVDCVANIAIYCRLRIQEKYAPLQLKFQYFKEGRQVNSSDLVMYISATNKMPSSDNHFIRQVKPDQILFGDKKANKKFESQYLYFCLLSEEGITLRIISSFNTEMEKRVLQKLKEKSSTIDLFSLSKSDDDNDSLSPQNQRHSRVLISSSKQLKQKRLMIQNEVNEAFANPMYKKLLLKNFKKLTNKRATKINSTLKTMLFNQQEKTLDQLGNIQIENQAIRQSQQQLRPDADYKLISNKKVYTIKESKSQTNSSINLFKEIKIRQIQQRSRERDLKIQEVQQRKEIIDLENLQKKVQLFYKNNQR